MSKFWLRTFLDFPTEEISNVCLTTGLLRDDHLLQNSTGHFLYGKKTFNKWVWKRKQGKLQKEERDFILTFDIFILKA